MVGDATVARGAPSPRGRASRVLRALTALAETVAAAAIGIIVVLVAYEVVARYAFGAPTVWTQEVCIYLLLFAAFLGMAPAERAGDHISIDLAVARLPPRMQARLSVANYLAVAAFSALVAWTGLEAVLQSYRYGRHSLSLLAVPIWIPQTCVPLGMALMTLEALRRAWVSARALRGSDP